MWFQINFKIFWYIEIILIYLQINTPKKQSTTNYHENKNTPKVHLVVGWNNSWGILNWLRIPQHR